jgi:hypothetical protein
MSIEPLWPTEVFPVCIETIPLLPVDEVAGADASEISPLEDLALDPDRTTILPPFEFLAFAYPPIRETLLPAPEREAPALTETFPAVLERDVPELMLTFPEVPVFEDPLESLTCPLLPPDT